MEALNSLTVLAELDAFLLVRNWVNDSILLVLGWKVYDLRSSPEHKSLDWWTGDNGVTNQLNDLARSLSEPILPCEVYRTKEDLPNGRDFISGTDLPKRIGAVMNSLTANEAVASSYCLAGMPRMRFGTMDEFDIGYVSVELTLIVLSRQDLRAMYRDAKVDQDWCLMCVCFHSGIIIMSVVGIWLRTCLMNVLVWMVRRILKSLQLARVEYLAFSCDDNGEFQYYCCNRKRDF